MILAVHYRMTNYKTDAPRRAVIYNTHNGLLNVSSLTYNNNLGQIELRVLADSTQDILELGCNGNQLIHVDFVLVFFVFRRACRGTARRLWVGWIIYSLVVMFILASLLLRSAKCVVSRCRLNSMLAAPTVAQRAAPTS